MRKAVLNFLFISIFILSVSTQTFLIGQISEPLIPYNQMTSTNNPEVSFSFKGDLFKVVLAHKSSSSVKLLVGVVVLDEYGRTNVTVQSPDLGNVNISLYRRGKKRFLRGHEWDLKDEVLASKNIYHTLRSSLSVTPAQQFPIEVRDVNNPEIRWSSKGMIFKVKLKSRFDDVDLLGTLRIEGVEVEPGHIEVEMYSSSCTGCDLILFKLEGDEWLESNSISSPSEGSLYIDAYVEGLGVPGPKPGLNNTFLIFRSAFDDHSGINLANYIVTVTLNGHEIFNGNPQIEHGQPFGRRFINFKDFKIEFDRSFLKVGQNTLVVGLSGVNRGDWFCWDFFTLDGIQYQSQKRWSTYSSTGVDGVYGGESRTISFTRQE